MQRLALIADLVRSRDIPRRAEFQRRLKSRLGELSARSAGELLSPWTLTLGDEFQALYGGFHGLFEDLFDLLEACQPQALRFAIGVGELSTAINPQAALEMDGPAFHRARAAMESLKPQARTGFLLLGQDEATYELPNATLALLAGELRTWKPSTHRIFLGLLRGEAVGELARATGLTARAIYKNSASRQLKERGQLLRLLEADLDAGLRREIPR